jgi:hypothetical protein
VFLLKRIGFLNPQEFEEGIIERYPIFLSIVLNHVSDDSTKDFAHAVDILKLLFEILGMFLFPSFLGVKILFNLYLNVLYFLSFLTFFS